MKPKEIAWTKLEQAQHNIPGFSEEAYFRIELVDFLPVEKIFSELPIEERMERISLIKQAGDEQFRQRLYQKAEEEYRQAYNFYKGQSKKERKTLEATKQKAYDELGYRLSKNYIRTLFFVKKYEEAKGICRYLLKHVRKDDIETCLLLFEVMLMNGENERLKQELKQVEKLPKTFV